MKSFLQLVAVFLCLGFIGYFVYINQDKITKFFYGDPTHVITIQGARFFATLVDTPEARAKGLSGTKQLGDLQVLLFVFDVSGAHGIWMKDMNYPIDIFWVSEDLQIVYIEKNVGPETYPKTFKPTKPARYVIEANAGVADHFNIRVGGSVIFPDSLRNKILSN